MDRDNQVTNPEKEKRLAKRIVYTGTFAYVLILPLVVGICFLITIYAFDAPSMTIAKALPFLIPLWAVPVLFTTAFICLWILYVKRKYSKTIKWFKYALLSFIILFALAGIVMVFGNEFCKILCSLIS